MKKINPLVFYWQKGLVNTCLIFLKKAYKIIEELSKKKIRRQNPKMKS